ncbi:MAG: hypothetical protein JJU11_10670 [Candidatus Sumerlaeia bacterium]|nr:hypothetical protein [Candidatus Sumerlaeia bacterium]
MNPAGFWRKFEEHFPLAAALIAGILFFLTVVVLRGFVGAAALVEWPLVILLLVNAARPLSHRVAYLLPVAAGLPFLEGIAPGVYLGALIGALLVGEIFSRRSLGPVDPVAHVLTGANLLVGWVAVRLFLGGGADVLLATLGAIVVVLMVWTLVTAWGGMMFLAGRSHHQAPKVTLGQRGGW